MKTCIFNRKEFCSYTSHCHLKKKLSEMKLQSAVNFCLNKVHILEPCLNCNWTWNLVVADLNVYLTYSLTADKIIAYPNEKHFQMTNVIGYIKFVFHRVENIVAEVENAVYQHFLFLSQRFKGFFLGASETVFVG